MAIAEWTEVDCELWCDACALAGMGHGRSFSLDPFGRVGPVLTLTQPHRDEQATGQSKSARIRQEKQKTETHRFQ